MQILIVGFQRSGTTMLRRILSVHPHVRAIFHENFLFTKYHTKEDLFKYLKRQNVHPYDENWGEKCPFYPSIRKIPVINYCRKWNEYFGETSRILHIVRHPIDVALSCNKKMKSRKYGAVEYALNLYQSIMRTYIPKINNMESSLTFKYEDLLIDPDVVLPQIFEFCQIDSKIDFRAAMSLIKNPRYKTIDPSRAFAYKKNPIKTKVNLTSTFNVINKTVGGVEYDL